VWLLVGQTLVFLDKRSNLDDVVTNKLTKHMQMFVCVFKWSLTHYQVHQFWSVGLGCQIFIFNHGFPLLLIPSKKFLKGTHILALTTSEIIKIFNDFFNNFCYERS